MADINALPVLPAGRTPRGAVKLNGTIAVGWTEWSVDNNAFRAADTFSITFAASLMPAGMDANWASSQSSITVEIFANEAPSDPANFQPVDADRLIYGQVDDINFNPHEGELVLTGRDLTAKLIDTKTSENHQNQTSSQVAALLAQRNGLTPKVTDTKTLLGNFYGQDHTDINQQISEWDLLVRLADFENFDVFVVGRELHFGPKPADSGDRYAIEWTPPTDDHASPISNVGDLSLSRSLTIASGVTVEVRSWHGKQKKAYTARWPKAATKTRAGQSGNSDQLTYHFSVPGLTQDQAIQRAQQFYNQIVSHMMKLEADLPADGLLNCTKIVQVRGTGTAWDQDYYPDSVQRTMTAERGYVMRVSAKNISADVEAAGAAT